MIISRIEPISDGVLTITFPILVPEIFGKEQVYCYCFFYTIVSYSPHALEALGWLVPDRRIEKSCYGKLIQEMTRISLLRHLPYQILSTNSKNHLQRLKLYICKKPDIGLVKGNA